MNAEKGLRNKLLYCISSVFYHLDTDPNLFYLVLSNNLSLDEDTVFTMGLIMINLAGNKEKHPNAAVFMQDNIF